MAKCYSCAVLLACSFTTRHDSGGMFVVHIVSVHSLQLLSDLKDRMWDKKVCVCARALVNAFASGASLCVHA